MPQQKILIPYSTSTATPEYDPETDEIAARQKEINAAVGSLLSDSAWVEETIRQDRDAYYLRVQLGELTSELIKAQNDGDKAREEDVRTRRQKVLEKLSQL